MQCNGINAFSKSILFACSFDHGPYAHLLQLVLSTFYGKLMAEFRAEK